MFSCIKKQTCKQNMLDYQSKKFTQHTDGVRKMISVYIFSRKSPSNISLGKMSLILSLWFLQYHQNFIPYSVLQFASSGLKYLLAFMAACTAQSWKTRNARVLLPVFTLSLEYSMDALPVERPGSDRICRPNLAPASHASNATEKQTSFPVFRVNSTLP